MGSIYDRDYDIEAIIRNERASKNWFATKYRPSFDIREDYKTSGQIEFIDKERLNFGEEALANIIFLTPEAYPYTLWIGRKLTFGEGINITGYAIVTKVFNKILEYIPN